MRPEIEELFFDAQDFLSEGQFVLAINTYKKALAKAKKGDEEEYLAHTYLGMAYDDAENPKSAIESFQKTQELALNLFGAASVQYATALANEAMVHISSKHLYDAEPLFLKAVAILDKIKIPKSKTASEIQHLNMIEVYANAGDCYGRIGDASNALLFMRKAHTIASSSLSAQHPRRIQAGLELGTLLAALGQKEESEALRQGVLSALEKTGMSPPEAIGIFMKAMSNISFMMDGIDGKVIPGKELGKQKSRDAVSNVVPLFTSEKPSSKKVSESVLGQPIAAYQLKIVLKRVTPAIWRRVVVPLDCSLEELHDIIQTAMGWFDSHLYEFRIGKQTFSRDPEFHGVKESREYTLRDFDFGINSTFEYLYDFGDDWLHSVKVENALSQAEYDESEIFVKGKGACPPEDCGGPYGFMAFLNALKSPSFDMSKLPEEFHDFDPLLLPECFYEKKKSSKRKK